MGQISYQQFEAEREQASQQSRNQRPRVAYFSLANNGDEAIVRFMFDSVEEFDVIDVHTAQVNGKSRKVNCIREATGDLSDCPFCDAQKPLQRRFYIHLLEYTRNERGEIVSTPKVWERSSAYITTLKNLCQEYSPLSDNIFKIKRNGAAGSVDTTYDILFANPNTYPVTIYKKDSEAFKDIKALGTCVFDYTYDQLKNLLETGSITGTPTPINNDSSTLATPVNPTANYSQDMNTSFTPRSYDYTADTSVVRPIRRY